MRVSTTKNINYTSNKAHATIHVHQSNNGIQKINQIDVSNSYNGRLGDKGVIVQLSAAIDALTELKEDLIKQGKEQ